MRIRPKRFNTYLLLTLCLALAGGCQTAEGRRKKEVSTLRLHLEVNVDLTDRSEAVPIYRAKPVWVNVDKKPFLDEANVVKATLVDVVGGFDIQIQFDRHGTWVLEQYTTPYKGRRIAVFSHFGEPRWLAAPSITRRSVDGLFTFTPDATHVEAERIVQGLNNVARKLNKASK